MKCDRIVCYLLHSRSFSETSTIAEIFTKDHGRIPVILKGSKRPRSPFQAHARPFAKLRLSAVGKGEILTATLLEPESAAHWLEGMILMSGLYVNELLYKLLVSYSPYPDAFDAYEALLEALSAKMDLQTALRSFELALLKALGYGIDFHYDSHQNPIQGHLSYHFDLQKGLFEYTSGIKGQTLQDYEKGIMTEKGALELKWLLRHVIQMLLGDKALHSRALVREIGVSS